MSELTETQKLQAVIADRDALILRMERDWLDERAKKDAEIARLQADLNACRASDDAEVRRDERAKCEGALESCISTYGYDFRAGCDKPRAVATDDLRKLAEYWEVRG